MIKGMGLDLEKVPWVTQMRPTYSRESLRIENLATLWSEPKSCGNGRMVTCGNGRMVSCGNGQM